MHKVIKIFGKTALILVLCALFLPFVLSLLLSVPRIQNYVADRAARFATEKIGATVAVGRVDVSLRGRIVVEDFYVEDYRRDTLLYVQRLDTHLPKFGFGKEGLCFKDPKASGVRLYLVQTEQGEMNIRPVVHSFSDPNRPKKGRFHLELHDAELEDMTLCIQRLNRRNPSFGIDYGNMRFEELDAQMNRFVIDGPVIHADIASLSMREQSGFLLNNLQGKFYLTTAALGFVDTRMVLPNSDFMIRELAIVGNAWSDYKEYISQVDMSIVLDEARVATDDIAWFAPGMRRWKTLFSDSDVEFHGTVDDFTTTIHRMRIGQKSAVKASGRVQGLPEASTARYDLKIPYLVTQADEAKRLARNIAGISFNGEVGEILSRTDKLRLTARFNGSFSEFAAQGNLTSSVGSVAFDAGIEPQAVADAETADAQPHRMLTASLRAPQLALGTLLDHAPLLGTAAVTAQVRGEVEEGLDNALLSAKVDQMEFNDYRYEAFSLIGRLQKRGFVGRLTSQDPNLKVQVDGSIDWVDSIPRYDMTAQLRHIDLAKLHFNRRDTLSQLSTRLVAKGAGRSLDDLNGRIQLLNTKYRYNDKKIEARSVSIEGDNTPDRKFVELRSDFADATFRSKTGYQRIFDYLRRSAWRYLPLLGSGESAKWQQRDGAAVANDYSLLDLKIRRFNPIADAISPGLQVADGSSMQLLFNPASDRLALQLHSEYIEHSRLLATRLDVNASNHNDSLTLYASAEDLYMGLFRLPRFSLAGGAKLGNVQLSAGFADTLQDASARLGVEASVDEQGEHGRTIRFRLLPSYITQGKEMWQLTAGEVTLDTTRLVVDRFMVRNRDQQLLLDGVASRRAGDSLRLNLRNFEIAPFVQFASRLGYQITGRTNGEALMTSADAGTILTADIRLDSLSANNRYTAPSLRLNSVWDFARNRAGVALTECEGGDTLLRGYYAPKHRRYAARMTVDTLPMALLDPLLEGVISSTKGRAEVDLQLQGEGRKAELSGAIQVRDLSTKIDFTQVTYTMPSAELKVAGNRFRASNVPIYDKDQHRGRFSLDLDLGHLSNIAYEVRVRPEKMLVLNTTSEDNELFHGRLYASGDARIVGNKAGVQMTITGRTEGQSKFFMPLSDKTNISDAEFVTFVRPAEVDTTDMVAERRRRFERRNRSRKQAAGMQIDLALDVEPNVEVEMMVSGSPIKARGEGALSMQIEPHTNTFEMFGDYTISEGSYNFSLQNIISKHFVIENGSMMQWTGDPVDPRLNIDAVYNLKTSLQPLLEGTTENVISDRSVPVECHIHIGERLTNPAISFDVVVPDSDPETQAVISTALSSPESVDMQFLYLLIFNNFMAENNFQANTNLGATASAATGLEFLTNQLSRLLSMSDYNLVIRYRPKTDVTSDEVDFGLSKSLINNRLLVEVEGNYLLDDKQAVNNSMSNFMGEAYVTYLIDRSGALKLKIFTQTIDRFDENQGLQETGVGIYYKEDFNNLHDLGQRIRDRFMSKRRRARHEAREIGEEIPHEEELPLAGVELPQVVHSNEYERR